MAAEPHLGKSLLCILQLFGSVHRRPPRHAASPHHQSCPGHTHFHSSCARLPRPTSLHPAPTSRLCIHRVVEERLIKMLNMTGRSRHKWDSLRRALADNVVYDDDAPRVFMSSSAPHQGLLYHSKQAQVHGFLWVRVWRSAGGFGTGYCTAGEWGCGGGNLKLEQQH